MTLTPTLVDNIFFANNAQGAKTTYWSFSFTNPYTAGGETLQISTAQTGGTAYFSRKLYGGRRTMVNPSVAVGLAGLGSTLTVRGDTSSYTSCVLQLFQGGLTTLSGTWIDNTTSNISTLTVFAAIEGY